MRYILFILMLSLMYVSSADDTINTATESDRYGIFDFMSVEIAESKAEEMAREGYRLGDYRYLVYGLRREDKSYGGYLEQHYGIKDTHVTDCIVTDSVKEATNIYNSTIKQLLTDKYGKDVFKETEEMSEQPI